MRAKFIYEAMEDILRPKSEEEILPYLNDSDPNELLIKSAESGFLLGAKLALERGANIHYDYDLAFRTASFNNKNNILDFLFKKGMKKQDPFNHFRNIIANKIKNEYGYNGRYLTTKCEDCVNGLELHYEQDGPFELDDCVQELIDIYLNP
jgi:hypothetical protein